ncbi:MAG: hypothetical protein DWQ02_19785 [Bacteroidetes bacterium]|nr:MAG: hypothetical protein DWQ02_19785 [Bacteroidota bacterium]
MLCFSQCAQEPVDISGHWHLYLSDEKGEQLEDELSFTLDVAENKYAFFDVQKVGSEDRQLFLDFEAGNKNLHVNVDSVDQQILPYSEVMPSHFDYDLGSDGNLILWTADETTDRKTYVAKRSKNCQRSDCSFFNPQVPNWCGMRQNLPDIAMNKREWTIDKPPTFDVYLGFLEECRLAGIDKQMVLNFNGKRDFTFGNIQEVLEGIKSGLPQARLGSVTFRLQIDDEIPYFVADYLLNHLKKAGWLRIVFVAANSSELHTKLPPFVENDCDPYFGRPCIRKEIITDAELAELRKHQLEPDWAPVVRESEYVIKPENLFVVDVKKDGVLKLNGEPLSKETIPGLAKEFLIGSGNPATKIFRIISEGEAHFGDYLEVHYLIRNMYDEVWEEKAQELFSKPYDQLERREMIQVRNKIPLVISVWKK